MFAETHHSCLEAKSLQPFLPECASSWKTQVCGALLPNVQDGEEKEGGGFGGGVHDGAGSSGRTGGACTHVHTCEHMWTAHMFANACGICHLGHKSGLQGVDGGLGMPGPQMVLKTPIFLPCTPPTPAKTRVMFCACCRGGGT